MAEIPMISITQEVFPDDVLDNDVTEQNLNEAHTDVENLDSDKDDDDDDHDSGVGQLRISAKNKKSIQSTTDIEDLDDSDSADDEKDDKNIDIKISLDEFLDQGYIDEAIKFSGHSQEMHDGRPKLQISKTPSLAMNNLGVINEDANGAVTDCENVDASDDSDDEKIIPNSSDDAIVLDESNIVESHDTMHKMDDYKPIHLTESSSSSDSDSDSENDTKLKPVYHKRHNKKKYAVSDTENIMFSDDEVKTKRTTVQTSTNSQSLNDGDEEVTIETSDVDESVSEKTINYPEIDITFVDDVKEPTKFKKQKKTSITLLGIDADNCEALTDVENLNSSSDDDNDDNQLIPKAVIKSKNAFLTDIEDFNDDIDNDDNSPNEDERELPLPSPTREMVVVKEDNTGRPTAKVQPLADNVFLGVHEFYIDKGLTDTEDLSDVEETICDMTKYSIEKMPDMESGNVHTSENMRANLKLYCTEALDPLTDTEDLCMTKDVRRKKFKHRGSVKTKSKFLDIKCGPSKANTVTTDVEEIDFSDLEEGGSHSKKSQTKKSNALMVVPVVNDDGKTDVEYLSGDENDDETMPIEANTKNYIVNDNFVSTITSKDILSPTGMSGKIYNFDLPKIRQISSSPDVCQSAYTDVEDIQVASDQDDNLCPETYSRAQTATPFEVHQALDESNSTVYDRNVNVFDIQMEKLNIKGHKECQEVHTDVEYLDEEAAINNMCKDNQQEDHQFDIKEDKELDLTDSDSLKGDYDYLIRNEAIHLVDSVLEQSLSIVNSQQYPDATHSESEHFAITSDISNGIDFIKSPTIESMSGKSFDDNISVPDENNDDNNLIKFSTQTDYPQPQPPPSSSASSILLSSSVIVDNNKKIIKIERKFERLSSQLDDLDQNEDICQAEFEKALSTIDHDEVSNLQNEFSKMSWDESISTTTADQALSTPDNDLQDLNQEPRRDPDHSDTVPKPTPRLSKSITSEESAVVASQIAAAIDKESESHSTDDGEKKSTTADAKTFSEKKMFWQSLESPKESKMEEIIQHTTITAPPPPVPKPRSQLSTSLSKGDEPSEAVSLKEDSKSEISSERHVEYGESDSIRSWTDSHSKKSKEDSILVEEQIEDESFPIDDSDRKIDEQDDKTECPDEKSFADDPSIASKTKTEEEIETDLAETKQAKFYIGESSTNIITKSQTEKRTEFAFDNEGYSHDSLQVDDLEMDKPVVEAVKTTESFDKTRDDDLSDDFEHIVGHAQKEKKTDTESKGKSEPKLELNLEKSEIEISEKIKYAKQEITKDDHDKIEFDINTVPMEARKVPVVHSPIKPFQNIIDYQKPVDIQEDIVTTAKATAVEVISDVESEFDRKRISLEKFAEVHSTKDVFKMDTAPSHLYSVSDQQKIDELVVEQTLAEVKESLEAVQEELIEVVQDGKLIKQSPSEFEFKVLPHVKYTEEPIPESYHEDYSASHGDLSFGEKIVEKAETQQKVITEQKEMKSATETQSSDIYGKSFKEDQSSSNEDSFNKLEVKHRKPGLAERPPGTNRWSATDPENYSSSGDSHYQSFEKTDSRPTSSDIENLLTSEYQTAADQSFRPGSTEYHSAISTLDHSGKTISSRESMKSLDSESSGNLASIEISEASETLVPSTMDLECEPDDFDVEDEEGKYGSLEEKGGTILLEFDDSIDHVSSSMKRSQEMTFQPELKPFQVIESPEAVEKEEFKSSLEDPFRIITSNDDFKMSGSGSGSYEESRFASSLEDGSILSVSLSSASCVETVMENLPEGYDIPSLSSSMAGSYEIQTKLTDEMLATSFEDSDLTYKIDDLVMTTSTILEDSRSSVNTQITTKITSESVESAAEQLKKAKGHKRTDSTSFAAFKGFDAARQAGELDDLDEEMIVHEQEPPVSLARDIDTDDKRGSGSDSDYDPYQTEYSRAYKIPAASSKSKVPIAEIKSEVFEKESDTKRSFSPSQSVIETIVEDVNAETELSQELNNRQLSQNMQDYHNLPDITITDDPNKYVSDDDEEPYVREDVSAPVVEPKKPPREFKSDTKTEEHKIQFAQESEYKMTEEQYEDLIAKQYKSKLADTTTKFDFDDDKVTDSPSGSDSFEMLEQPDISDEFVIIEEVAKEADEFDSEGKSVSIKPIKKVKKHDDEVEKYLVKSAPAAPNEGSMMYAAVRDDLGFGFEESPPLGEQTSTGVNTQDSGNGYSLEASKRWVEMQLADSAQNLRYPYDMERGILEDIKEEDTDFEVGSSRISSFKDSFSSTPDYDVLAGRRYFSKEHDDISMSSLQEFESLEQAISLENRKTHQGSQDSLSNGSFPKRYLARSAEGDGISLSSLKEFEGLENACLEAHLLEIKAKEEAALLLSRSDESNKSDDAKITTTKHTGAVTTVTTVTSLTKSNNNKRETVTTSGFVIQRSGDNVIRKNIEDVDEESLSNLMTTSTDSLEATKPKQIPSERSSRRDSTDSLEINKSAFDVMTSSVDSIEVMREGMTAKSSRSDVDSIEQAVVPRSDSIDSIELQSHGSKFDRDSIDDGTRIDISSSTTTHSGDGKHIVTQTIVRTVTTTHGEMPKDISNDSLNSNLNLNPLEPELLLTSTDSLDQTSSTATNATYRNECDSQMSGSMTSCDSNTMIDTLDSNIADFYSQGPSPSQMFFDEKYATTVTTTTTTTTVHSKDEGDESFEQFESLIRERDFYTQPSADQYLGDTKETDKEKSKKPDKDV